MRHLSSKTSKKILIALIVALLLSIVFSATFLIPKYRLLDEMAPPELLGETLDQILDGYVVSLLISEFQIRNDGAYPPVQYLTETMSPHYPLFIEEIQIKSESDHPSATAWPGNREFHIWPGYACATGGSYKADEMNYEELIREDPEEFAIIEVNMLEIMKQGSQADIVYSCLYYNDDQAPQSAL